MSGQRLSRLTRRGLVLAEMEATMLRSSTRSHEITGLDWPSRGVATRHGMSHIELMVVLSIVTTLAAIGASYYPSVRRSLHEAECRTQLADIHFALIRYRDDHGQDPPNLTVLVPKYLHANRLICPFVRARAPELVERVQTFRRATALRY